jgi:hypothetical protein
LDEEKKQRRMPLPTYQRIELLNERADSLGKLMTLFLEEAVVRPDQQQDHEACSAGWYPSIGIRPCCIAS